MSAVDENLTARAKLIFERDNNSPLFLRTADFYLQQVNPQTSLSILENGLLKYPEHPLTFILLAKAQYFLGNILLSEKFFLKAGDILNSPETFEFYKKEFKIPDKPISPFDYSRGNIFIDSTDEFVFEEPTNVNYSQEVDDNLSQIAEKLMNSRIEQNSNLNINESAEKGNEPDKSVLATETFANIYLSQGQKNEALKVYELLVNRYPEKKEYFLEKIRKIKIQ